MLINMLPIILVLNGLKVKKRKMPDERDQVSMECRMRTYPFIVKQSEDKLKRRRLEEER